MHTYQASFVLRHHKDLSYYANAHAAYEIIAVTDGCLFVCVNGTDICVKSGQAVFLPPYFAHSFRTEVGSVCHIWEFSSSLVPEKLPDDIILFPISCDTSEFFYRAENTDSILAQKAAIYRILSMMGGKSTKKYSLPLNDVCLGAVKFIAENFAQPITMRDAAKHLCVNYSYLSRAFKECEGLSFTECLNGTRLNHAASLLCQTNMTVTDIALSCGFGSVRNFNRLFAARLQCSPYEFRKTQVSSI